MDPAGPLFEGKNWAVGLNPSCASFVDVMHTNGEPGLILNLGTMKVLGHVDFYPNKGDTQPGCILDPFDPDVPVQGQIHGKEFEDAFIGMCKLLTVPKCPSPS